MTPRIRTLNFLPEIFRTTTNSQFLSATLDQIVQQPRTQKIEGYIGSKFGYGINAKDNYVTEPTKIRTDYQLDPGVVFLNKDTETAKDFISYPGLLDALKIENGITNDNSRLFESEFYSWDSFTDLDKIINFHQYYWVPTGPEAVVVSTETIFNNVTYVIDYTPNGYIVSVEGDEGSNINPTIRLLRGCTYYFRVNQPSSFWIQGYPGLTGINPAQSNVQTREVIGVTNNGISDGLIRFDVPQSNSLEAFQITGENHVDVVSTLPFSAINGQLLSSLPQGIDGVTSLNGLKLMFYQTGTFTEQQNFYTISYSGSSLNPTLNLTISDAIPSEEKIHVRYGTEYISKSFYRNSAGYITLIPYNSTVLDTLYYQDGTSSNSVGQIKIFENNLTSRIDVINDILGKKQYTAPNGVTFTNGLKIIFQGNVYPNSYINNEYYVEGVGTAIELLNVPNLVAPEPFTSVNYFPYDLFPFDIGSYDADLYIPIVPDYITIARNSISRNPWSRSNRWFHVDVLEATAQYNNNPELLTLYTQQEYKAKRPIIEFYPNLKLFNTGIKGKDPIDFFDTRTTDALNEVEGQLIYYPDVEVFTSYTATILPVTGPIVRNAIQTVVSPNNSILLSSAIGLNVRDPIVFTGTVFGGVVSGTTYYIIEVVNTTTIKISATEDGEPFNLVAGSGTMTATVTPLSTEVTIQSSNINGSFQVGQFIADSKNALPNTARITKVTNVSNLTTIVASWSSFTTVTGYSGVSLVANDLSNDNYEIYEGSKIVFSNDTNLQVRNKIYIARYTQTSLTSPPVITLSVSENGEVLDGEQVVVFRGYNNQGQSFYFKDGDWIKSQQKTRVNQPPLFDVFDTNGISFGDAIVYEGTTFEGNKLFAYGLGVGNDDPVLGFPLRYSNVQNVGDISFDVSLNKDTFEYINSATRTPIVQNVNTGYVYNYSDIENYIREIGWQTAVGLSVQYQIFEFNYIALVNNLDYTLDVAMVDESDWPSIQVFVNNDFISDGYTVSVSQNSTVVTFANRPSITDTVIQIAVLSNQVSSSAYYGIPVNLNNNPLNADITQVNIGDIRGQYQSIFYNNPNTTGPVFGPNNYRDLGNLVPFGNRIIQNSASLVLPGAFLRQQNHNLFNALSFNSSEYISFKTLLINTVFNTEYNRYQPAAFMLDDALEQISATRTDGNSFFWSDMLPSKSAFIANTYTFANLSDNSIFPLSKVYDFKTANYNGVLVYLTRSTVITQLMIGTDYTVSDDSPSLTITLDLLPNDLITIKEYNQTYGSFVPNTPTKLGLYPSYLPKVILDNDYSQPTYFILGHDGSYTKLYGAYDPITGQLQDFRDQVLLEFEKRIFNNLKLDNVIPITESDVVPGFFRNTDYSYQEIQEIYSVNFLNWIGQNRIDYKTQFYNANNQFTYNYNRSGNKINNEQILQGYWRGVYNYFYDTFNPDTTPWEMLGFSIKPTWWDTRYGPAPYTSDNLILWNDLAQGINYNNGDPIVLTEYVRPELLQVLPVNSAGNIVSPFNAIVGNYSNQSFIKDWKVGDIGPAELSYRRSSSYPFDLMKIFALTKPAQFFNLAVDVDNYKYNAEFNQYLVNNRGHLVIRDIEVYGSGTAKTSYINWIVDYEKQVGVDATTNIQTLLQNLDVRLVYRVAGFTDKDLLKFYVEKGTPNSTNASLLIPDESYSVLLYDNQPFDKIIYSGVIIQQTVDGYFKIYGNSQTTAYFKYTKPKINGNFERITIGNLSVQIPKDFTKTYENIAYGTEFYSVQEVANFLTGYGQYLIQQGLKFAEIESGIEVNWNLMIGEFLYWAQSGWEVGSLINLNPAAKVILIDKDNSIVQPLTLQQQNFILNQNLYPIQSVDLSVVREGTAFSAKALNEGDTIAYGQFNIFNFEHGIVFNNITLFDDIIYNLTTGLRQNRIFVRGTKSAEWNGTVDAQGFILNQDNILEWNSSIKYTKGEIVKFKNKFWTALKIIQPKNYFEELEWKETDYNEIQKGLLPNSSTRSYESTIYYDSDKANLERDADLLSFSLIGYRPRDYLALADLTDITQINVYKNLIKNKGTRNSTEAFKGAILAQGGIEYDIYENWAIKSGEFGSVYNTNFIELKLSQPLLVSNPSIVGLTNGVWVEGVQQQVPIYSLFNYSKPVFDANVLTETTVVQPSKLYPDAGYVNFNDVKTYSFFYSGLSTSIKSLNEIYVGDYIWIANQQGKWSVLSPVSSGQIIRITNTISDILNITFLYPHNLTKYQSFAIVNFSTTFDGYYIVNNVIDPYTIQTTISAAIDQETFTGNGICLSFANHRVTYISDISSLSLLQNEFYKNKVWVDIGTSGGWEVIRKSINYNIQGSITLAGSSTFGSSVITSTDIGYLISDAGLGTIYRYTFNPLENTYTLFSSKAEAASYGTALAYAGQTYVVSQPLGATASDRKVYIYRLDLSITVNDLVELQAIEAPSNLITNWGSSIAISGDEKWIYISDTANNKVYVYNLSPVTDLYEYVTYLSSAASQSGDSFGSSIATTYYGDKVIIGSPYEDVSVSVLDVGKAYVFDRYMEKFVAQYNSATYIPTDFVLVSPPPVTVVTVTATTSSNNSLTIANTNVLSVGIPLAFSGNLLSAGAINPTRVYYVKTIIDGTRFTVSLTRGGSIVPVINDSGSMLMNIQTHFPYISQNGTLITDNNYFVVGNVLSILSPIRVGDLIEVSVPNFVESQRLSTINTTRSGSNFGFSLDTTTTATEILISSIYEQYLNNEGAVYRFTNSGSKYGYFTGTSNTNLTGSTNLIINGASLSLVAGNAASIASQINGAQLTNIIASATNGKLTISVVNKNLATPNNLLSIIAPSMSVWNELGIQPYTRTQVLTSPHNDIPTQYGYSIKFNQYGSFVVSAPVSDRFVGTSFDQTDDENFDNDTIFDNNSTQFVDSYVNAGSVYMYDYLTNYNENLNNVGKFVYAQSVNDNAVNYGSQPFYGQSLYFNNYTVVVGTPQFDVGTVHGKVLIFDNSAQQQDWAVYRKSSAIVDTSKLQNIQLFSALTNETLENLDFIDPLQGKILGVVRENLDVISNVDPASYNSPDSTTKDTVAWGPLQLGQLWFNTSNVRFVNYHQDDIVYNSEYWGAVFPGSDVAVYSWIASDVPPIEYQSQGVPFNIDNYVIQYKQDARGNLVPVYYFWVRNSNVIFTKLGKTLSDTILESYIENPKASGISYFAPLLPSTFALYNSIDYINDADTVLHIGYLSGNDDDSAHSVFNLIRVNNPDDFLPGLPNTNPQNVPQSLYDRMLDSLAGVDETGAIVPDPYLPKAVQIGIYARPRQSFFLNRFNALKNYLIYANEILSQYPITEIRNNISFLQRVGPVNPSTTNNLPTYDVTLYWEYINWWAEGYDNNTKSAVQVPIYADLSALQVPSGTIVTVAQNSAGLSETYVLNSNNVWDRIGLQNGTIKFKTILWDYPLGKIGYGDNFFDATPYDDYPSEETRLIIRALNEQIYIDELLIHRNKSLILLFEYAQSETIESQNYLPWLNKTSLVDVTHTIRELRPIENFQSDNEVFLESYLNEAKPYHVLIKEFVFKYTGTDVYEGDISDFDLPAQFDFSINQFMTPMLVKDNPSGGNEFAIGDPIWQTTPYNQWYQNRGLTIVGVDNYPISILAVYVERNSNSIYVENIYGFPVAGTIRIDDEIIVYSAVDRVNNRLYNLTRGYNSTDITTHLPNQQIFIDLPPITLLDSGRGYTIPPRITAYIDTALYPVPTRIARFEAVMNLDKLLYINTIDPGDGYEVLPEIIIEPSITVSFRSIDVLLYINAIRLLNPVLQTGDLVRYVVGTDTDKVGGLYNNQYYYVKVLDIAPTFVIALYTNYANAINNVDRVALRSEGLGNNNYLEVSARATCVSDVSPIRENKLTLRYDRTTYDPNVIDWTPGSWYSSFYAGQYKTSEVIASSTTSLAAEIPPINDFVSSIEGASFQISAVSSENEIVFSSRTRTVVSTTEGSNIITIAPSLGGAPDAGFINPTTGFYVGMPIKFEGTTIGGIVTNRTYYVASIASGTEITITETQGSTTSFNLNNGVPLNPLYAIPSKEINTTIITIDYPGIRPCTSSNGDNDSVTIPLTFSGLGGTEGLYPSVPVFFTGPSFGDIVENEIYYVSTVLSNTTMTLMTESSPLLLNVVSIDGTTNIITCDNTSVLGINDPIIFTSMTIAGTVVTNFGNIEYGTKYYVNTVVSSTEFTIKPFVNFPIFDLATVSAASNTGCVGTNQRYLLDLSTGTGNLTMYIGLPISPGQLEGQKLNFYKTNLTGYSAVTGTSSDLITRKISATVSNGNNVGITTLSGGLPGLYVNLPIRLETAIGGLSTGVTYYIKETGTVSTAITSTSSTGNEILSSSTQGFYVGMLIRFAGSAGFGNVQIATTYYIKTIVDGQRFTISETLGGATLVLENAVGSMTLNGEPYIRLSNTLGGSVISVTDATGPVTLTQYTTTTPSFNVKFELGGYLTEIVSGGAGFTVNNTISISGASLGGTDPQNDLTLLVDAVGPNGEITKVISYGKPVGPELSFYVDVITANQCKLYFDVLKKVPVPITDFPYLAYDYGFLPEPFLFEQSIVKYNNRVWECVVSNDDEEFIVGKWELVGSGDRRLNALDRISGYYEPTVNMPGNDISQLLTGTTYPYITYSGNSFSPEDEFIIDTQLLGGTFIPENVNSVGIIWNGTNYVGVVNSDYSGIIVSPSATKNWVIDKITEQNINITNIGYDGSRYIITTNNVATPILTSTNLTTWTGGYPAYPVNATSLNGVANYNGIWIVVGTNILASTDGITWNQVYQFNNTYVNQLNDVYGVGITNFNGFVSVGLGQHLVGSTVTNKGLLLLSINNGQTWTEPSPNLTTFALNGITSGANLLVVAGNNNKIFYSNNGSNWTQAISISSLINWNSWTVGSGSVLGYGQNGQTNENERLFDTNPWGISDTVWEARPLAQTNDDGGWNTAWFNIDHTKLYRYSVWVRRTSDSTGGTFYFGMYANGDGSRRTDNNSIELNAYWECSSTSILTKDQWYLWVGYVYPSNTSFTGRNPNTGYYTVENGRVGNINGCNIGSGDLKWSTNSTQGIHRTYLYYCADNTTRLQFYQPRVDLVDGNEPSIDDLLTANVNLNDVAYGNNIYVAVGNNGSIKTSSDAINWVDRNSGVSSNLTSVVFNEDDLEFVVVGENNAILESVDGITWTEVNTFATIPSVYDLQGQPFLSGYGPEELVPGVVSDTLQMIISTRPGTTWNAEEYQHVGYNVVSQTFTPTSGTEVTLSFEGIVETPAMLSVWILDSTNDFLATRLYVNIGYTVNWITKTVTLATAPILGNKVYLEIYEVGNGNQLVKSSSDYEPIRINSTTGFKQMALNCNYSAIYSQGSGVIRNLTTGVNVEVTSTSAIDNTFLCSSVENFVVNNIITFQGTVFGGVTIDTNYYVKTVSLATNKITISDTLVAGVAGPVYTPTTASGSMEAIIQEGSGLVWTDPIVYHNGNRLVSGTITRITRTSSSNNAITCNSTSSINIGDTVVFSDTMFGGISPQTVYFVKTIVDSNEFTISATLGGSILALTSASGGATAITNDFAFGISENGINADLIFASQYSKNTDYITFTVFGEVIPYSYGYTLPETENFVGDGVASTFTLSNNVSGVNPDNAIVEIDGLRISNTEYTIDPSTDVITFTSAPNLNSNVSITSFNETDRQYFLTEYDITGKQVANIISINNNISLPIATVLCTNTSSATNEITCTGTENFVVNQPVYFNAPVSAIGGINITDTIYYVHSITSITTFKISTSPSGSVFTLTNGTGTMFAYVGGQPAVRVTTGIPHGFVTNNIVRIDSTEGSVQLNNNTYYARVVDTVTFDLYTSAYTQSYTGTNNPVTDINTYTQGGFVWLDKLFTLVTTTATATNGTTKYITVTDVSKLIVGTPIIFTGTTFGGIVAGTTYYINVIDGSNIKVTATRDGDVFPVTTSSGTMNLTQWEQLNVDRLWVTVNGYRVPSSKLYLNADNNLSILTLIETTDVITIMSMMPSATPNEMVYMQNVNKNGEPSVYRADNLLTTWLVQDLLKTDSTIYLDDISRVIDREFINTVVPIGYNSVTNPLSIQLNVDKSLISQIIVVNNTTGLTISSTNYRLEIINLSPVLVIFGSISIGDSLTITVILGNTIFLNGEQIRFTVANFTNNTITGLQRGANGTGEQFLIPKYTKVYGDLTQNKLANVDYFLTWNSNIYNTVEGDPLQVSITQPAIFLRTYRS